MRVTTLQPSKILRARLTAELSQDRVADALKARGVGASAKQVWRWEQGIHTPRASVIPVLAEVLGVDMDELFGDDEDEEAALLAVTSQAARELSSRGSHRLAAELQREISRVVSASQARPVRKLRVRS
jgi:transcriptional regulator with XRE-family HTH domain